MSLATRRKILLLRRIACQIIALIESIVDTRTKAAGNTFAVDNSFVNKREMTLIPFA